MDAMTTDEPRSRAECKAATRVKVLKAARILFAKEGGYEAATIRSIAELAGRSTGSVYSNFLGKADVLTTILRDDDDQFFAQFSLETLGRMSLEDAYLALLGQDYKRHAAQPKLLLARLTLRLTHKNLIEARMLEITQGLLHKAIECGIIYHPAFFGETLLDIHAGNLAALASGTLTLEHLVHERLPWQVTNWLTPFRLQ